MKENEKKGSIICKKTKCIVVNKWSSPTRKLQIRDTKIKQVQQFKYLGIVLTKGGNSDWRHRHPKAHWDNERGLPKSRQSIKKREHFVRHKEKSTELLPDISPPIWQ